MSAHAYELPIEEPAKLNQLAEDAAGGEVVYLTHHGHRLALVSEDVALVGTAAIQAMEDAADVAAADAAMDEPGESIPAEQLWAELGI